MSILLKRIRNFVAPSSRQKVTWISVLPLVFFLLSFVAVNWSLEVASVLTFSQLWPFGLLAFLPWIWWVWVAGLDGLPRWRSLTALLSRFCLFGLIVIVLAEPRSVSSNNHTTVIYAVDLSGSVGTESTDQVLNYVARVGQQEKPPEDSTGLVYFGRDAGVQIPPMPHPFAEDFKAIDVVVRRDGTNIAQALSLSAAVLPEDQNGRIVLISDGVSTEGELSSVLSDLKSKKIAVDVLPIIYRYEDEVWLERMDVPRAVKEGETYEVSAVLASLRDGKGKLSLHENGRLVFEQEVEYTQGKNRFTAPIQLREPGYYEYSIQLAPITADHIKENNIAIGSIFLDGKGRTLLVTSPFDEPRVWQPLANALTNTEQVVRQISSHDLPDNPLALKAYDAVVFVNVGRDEIDQTQMQAVHDAIYHEGVGFLMVGGSQSFGPGGWGKTVIEQALPVDMDITQRKAVMNGALILVIDHSGSMGEQIPGADVSKQVLANRAAAAALRSMVSRDWLGVVTFDFTPTWIVPFDLNREPEEAARRVRSIGSGGGTNMYPALFQAVKELEDLEPADAATKHIILLTDGRSQPGAIRELVERCIASKISISTIGVGDPLDVDNELLDLIARETKGRFFPAADAQNLPRILIREVIKLRENAIWNAKFQPEVSDHSPIFKGIDGLPPLHGMVLTVPKPRAELPLMAPEPSGGEATDPVLALQRYGMGRTAAFTSDLSPNWGQEWVNWDHYQAFVRQLLIDISRVSGDGQLQLTTDVAGTEAVIQIENHATDAELMDVRAAVHGPDGKSQPISLRQSGPRRFQARIPLEGQGRYLVTAVSSNRERASGGFVVPFSQEYLRFSSNHQLLNQIAAETGGRVLYGDETGEDLYSALRESRHSSKTLVVPLLLLLAILVPVDVGFRRIHLDYALFRGLFARRTVERNVTVSTLLHRKQELSESLPRARASTFRPQPTESTASTRASKRRPSVVDSPRQTSVDGTVQQSTTSKLLETLHRHRAQRDGYAEPEDQSSTGAS